MSRPPSEEVTETAMARAREIATGLYPHQVDGVAFLLARRRAILADDMGLGKTRQSIVAMVEAEPAGPWLIVCPASVKRNWEREIRSALIQDTVDSAGNDAQTDCPTNVPAEILVIDAKTPVPAPGYRGWLIVNYDIVKKHAAALRELPLVGFVFDEAHYLKNHRTQRSRAARSVLKSAREPVVHCLTGTPMVNRPRDLFPLLQLVNHSLGKSFLGFAKRYCDARKGDYGWETKGASNLDELTLQLHGTMLRRTKDEVLDLPGKMRNWLTVDIPKTTANRGMRRVLATLLKETSDRVKVENGSAPVPLPPISRSKLLARLTPIRSVVAGAKIPYSVEFAKGILDQGEKVIIYTCFQEAADAIADEFAREEVRVITGGTSPEMRQQAVDDFQDDDRVRVMCATVIAGGVGITLTATRTVIFNDLDWVPANHWQAEDRAYRIGQAHPVNVYYFIAANSIDEFVGQVLRTKSNLINAVVDGNVLPSSAQGADPRVGGDVLAELESVLRQFGVGQSAMGMATETDVDRLLDRLVDKRSITAHAPKPVGSARIHHPNAPKLAAIQALARALSPTPTLKKYRVLSSQPGQYHELELCEPDVVCSCRGFEFRGQCKHARALRDALARGDQPPDEFELI